jgi:hypothetical protein
MSVRAKFKRSNPQPSKMDLLTDLQRSQVDTWLIDQSLSYPKVCALILERFGLRVSQTGIYNYFQKKCVPIIQARARLLEPLTLDVVYIVRRGTEVIGEHKTTLPLTKETTSGSGAMPIPASIQKAIQEALN